MAGRLRSELIPSRSICFCRLHICCMRWNIPDWEKSLRQRIWWAIVVHDAWSSFLNSRPSHLQAGNSNVGYMPLPTPHDTPETYRGAISFHYLCRLSIIVGHLQHEVSTLERYGTPQRVASCQRLEGELDALKTELGTHPPPLQMEAEISESQWRIS